MAKRSKASSRGFTPGDYSRQIRRSDYPGTGGSYSLDPNAEALPRADLAVRRLLEAFGRPPGYLPTFPRPPSSPTPLPFKKRGIPRVYLPPAPTHGRIRKPSAPSFASLKALHTPEAYRARHCLDRKTRREVLFALRIPGKSGIGRGKRWRRTAASHYSC